MKLQQLRFFVEITRQKLNVSAAAERLYTSQPGISKQIKLLEEELGVGLLLRSGKHLAALTPAGQAILPVADQILAEVEKIRCIAAEHKDNRRGSLSIATTHTQARYALPDVIRAFIKTYPQVALHMHQGTPVQISELAVSRRVDFAIATEALELFEDLVMLPCYRWNRSVIVPRDHPLTRASRLTLEAVADYPLITYVFGFTGRSQLDQAFNRRGLTPRVVLTAVDADVIKTYVKLGLGIGIMATMAYDRNADSELCALDAGHLFEPSTTKIGFRKGAFLRGYMYYFIERFAPHLTREVVEAACGAGTREEIEKLINPSDLPVR